MKKTLRLSRLKRVALTLLLGLSAGTVQAQTINVVHNYATETMTVTVTNPEQGVTYRLYYSDDDVYPAYDNGELAIIGTEADAAQGGGWTIPVSRDASTISITAFSNVTESDNQVTAATEACSTQVNIAALRYQQPTWAMCTTYLSIVVTAATEAQEVTAATSLEWNTDAGSATVNYTTGAYTFCNSDADNTNDFIPITSYTLRSTGAGRYPSAATTMRTDRYYQPAIENYVPYQTGSAGITTIPMSGTLVSGPESSNAHIYVNYDKFEDDHVTLKDPNPYDNTTWSEHFASGTTVTGRSWPLFKMIAGPADPSGDRSSHLVASQPRLVDTTYANADVFFHVTDDGVTHYLAYDPANNAIVDATAFSYDCLWERNARNNHLYHKVGGIRHRLGIESVDGNNFRLVVHDAVLDVDTWLRIGNRMILNDYHGHHIAYENGWAVTTHEGGSVDTSVAYQVKHHPKAAGYTYVLDGSNVDLGAVTVPAVNNGPAAYEPTWIAVDQGASYTLTVSATGQVDRYQLPDYDDYFFNPLPATGVEEQHMYFYRGQSVASITDLPNIHSRVNADIDSFSYEWRVVRPDGTDASGLVTLNTSSRGQNATVSHADVQGPTKLRLEVWAVYRDRGINSDGTEVTATSEPRNVTLFAERKLTTTAANLTTVPHTDGTTPQAFVDNGEYLLMNFDPVGGSEFYVSPDGTTNAAALTTLPRAARMMKVTLENGSFKFVNPVLTTDGGTTAYYLNTPDAGMAGYYIHEADAAVFSNSYGSNDILFIPTVYKNGDGAAYFTLRPYASPAGISLEPRHDDGAALRAEGRPLRRAGSLTSRTETLRASGAIEARQTAEEAFYATRWQLVSPKALPPAITMNPEGIVTIEDTAGHRRQVYGTLKYRVKRAPTQEQPNPAWSSDISFTTTASQASQTLDGYLGEGDCVEAWKTGTSEHYAASDTSRFVARRTAMPTIGVEGHSVVFHATDTVYVPAEGQEFYFYEYEPEGTATGITPAHDATGVLSNRYEPMNYKVYAVGPNCLKSATTLAYLYKPKLEIGGPGQLASEGDYYDVLAYVGNPSTAESDFTEWSTAVPEVHLPETTNYTIHYTLNGDPVTQQSPQCAPSEADYSDGLTYFTIPTPDGYANIKIKAFPVEGSNYTESDEVERLFHTNILSIYDTVVVNGGAAYHTHAMVPNEVGGIADLNDILTETFAWFASSDAEAPTAIRNRATNKYLVLQRPTDENGVTQEPALLHTSDIRLDGPQVEYGGTQFVTASSTWHWTGEGELDGRQPDSNKYKLYTDLDEFTVSGGVMTPNIVRYYLVFDRQESAWTAVPQNHLAETLENSSRLRYNSQIAFRTRIWDYPGGQDYIETSAQLEMEVPTNSGNWEIIGDPENHGWAALSEGDSIHLRATFNGNRVTYEGNEVVYIIRPPYDNNFPERDTNHYNPWQFWIDYGNGYTQTPQYTAEPVNRYFDSLSTVVWKRDAGFADDQAELPTEITLYTLHGRHAADEAFSNGDFNTWFNWRHVPQTDYITLVRTGSGNVPDLTSMLKAEANQLGVYTAGLLSAGTVYPLTMHLFAEGRDNRTSGEEGEGEYPTFNGEKRWRFLSKSYSEAAHDFRYLTSDHHNMTLVNAGRTAEGGGVRYPYLAGQLRMGVQNEYTYHAVWMMFSQNLGSQRYVTITSPGAQDKNLVHLPENAAAYESGTMPAVPENGSNGVYLFDPTSREAVSSLSAAPEIYDHSEDYLHFAIRQFRDGDGSYYVTLSPFYRTGTSQTGYGNMARYLSLNNGDNHNHPSENRWLASGHGRVPQLESITNALTLRDRRAACQAAAAAEFWRTRWHMEQAHTTPPMIEMDPEGNVTIEHNLSNFTITHNGEVVNLSDYIKFYYTIVDNTTYQAALASGDAAMAAIMPSFTGTTGTRHYDWKPGEGFAPSTSNGTLLYDPAHKPVLHEGEWISVVSVVTDPINTPHFTLQKHISREHHFQALKSAQPQWADNGESRSVLTFDRAGGDSLLVGTNVNTVTWSDLGSVGGVTYYAANGTYNVPAMANPLYAWRAFQHNKLQSEPRYLYTATKLVLEVESHVTAGADSADVAVTVHTIDGYRMPLASYYTLQYSTADAGTGGAINWNSHAGVRLVTDNPAGNTYTYRVPLISVNASETTYLAVPFRVKAIPVEGEDFYTSSDEALRFLIHSDYAGSNLTGDGTASLPYQIATPVDLVSAAHSINNGTGTTAWYRVTADIDMHGDAAQVSIGASTSKFAGHWDGGYHTLSGLTNPLFEYSNGGHIYNVVIDRSTITGTGSTGGICSRAEGATRIYNCGVRNSDGNTTVTGSVDGSTGGIVGYISGSARVVNCYNYATVSSSVASGANSHIGGIIGRMENANNYGNKDNQKLIVFACANYGTVHKSPKDSKVYPVIGALLYSSTVNKKVNTYNYFNIDAFKVQVNNESLLALLQNDGSFGSESEFFNRFEMLRYNLNSSRKRSGWWVNAPEGDNVNGQTPTATYFTDVISADNNNTIGKWVLDTTIAPYPVVLPKYDESGNPITYPSVINPDYEADWRDTAQAYHGRRLTTWGYKENGQPTGKLKVNIDKGDHGNGILSLRGENSYAMISITDMDTLVYDYNYGKIQLPYFQDYFKETSSGKPTVIVTERGTDWIVTGWEISAVQGGTAGTFSTSGENPYNFADRNCTAKDDYETSGRIFAQGGFYNVPYGVTEITVTAHWGKAHYLKESKNDSYYNGSTPSACNIYGDASDTVYGHNKTTHSTIANAIAAIKTAQASGATVYDNALVLLSDFHVSSAPCQFYDEDNTPFTVTTVDEDNDHEPDHVLYQYFGSRRAFNPIRFDFINYAELSMASRSEADASTRHLGLTCPKGHYEITETAMALFYQFEYDNSNQAQDPSNNRLANSKTEAAPLILNGGVFRSICSGQHEYAGRLNKTTYILMGGHVYHNTFAPGANPFNGKHKHTYHCPIIVTGGEYEQFYLSGYLFSVANPGTETAYLYASGGRFGHYASGGYEEIKGDVKVLADHIIADEFYGGGINPNITYTIKGSIDITLDSSIIHKTYAAGPKFGTMQNEKTVTTHATGTSFGEYYGAGIGGTGKVRYGLKDAGTSYTYYKDAYNGGDYKEGKWNTNGIDGDYEFEFLPWSTSIQFCYRFSTYRLELSKAMTNGVESVLKGCTIHNNYYGGGYVGKVQGTAKSTLEDCIVEGSVFAGGNSSAIPTAKVYPMLTEKDDFPKFVGGTFIDVDKNKIATPKVYTWNTWASAPGTTGNPLYVNNTDMTIYTSQSLNDMGQCTKTDLTLSGNTVVYGSVYGGGNEAETGDPNVADDDEHKPDHYTEVLVKDSVHVMGDVVAAGRKGKLTGSSSLTIGAADGDTSVANIPWVEGDVYGGAYSADVDGYSNILIYDGVLGPVYGGGYTGSVYKESNVKVLGGRIGYSKDTVTDEHNVKHVTANPIEIPMGDSRSYYGVFGAGFGFGTSVGKDAHVSVGSSVTGGPNGQHNHIYINGSVFGGGEAGQVGTGFEIYHGKTVPAGYWYVDGEAGTYTEVPEAVPNEPTNEHSFYAQFYRPTFTTTTVSIQAPNKADGSLTTNITGAVFGGGRGYYIMENEDNPGTYSSTLNTFKLAIAGAVYGNTEVTIGTEDQKDKANGINIGSVRYFTDQVTAEKYGLIDLDNMQSRAVYFEEGVYVYDVDKLQYLMVGKDDDGEYHNVVTHDGGTASIGLWVEEKIDNVMYFINSGRASVVGGGESGHVFGDTIFTWGLKKSKLHSFNYGQPRFGTRTTTGNTVVNIYSGTLGDILDNEVDGCVYGGGLNADVDGTSRVTIDGTHAWVRGDVYAGGCMGSVYGYGRANAGVETITTQQDLVKGWVRNAHGGSNLAAHGSGCNSKLVVGEENGDDTLLLVSESVYGGNGFSPSLGTSEVVMHSGSIGFVRAGYDINNTDPADRQVGASENDHSVVQNYQGNLSYEGNVYGGGFGPQAWVRKTQVTVNGGIVRDGVFGGGELSPVGIDALPNETRTTSTYPYYSLQQIGTSIEAVSAEVPYVDIETDPLTEVTVNGGEMAMVLGGGRGYTGFMHTYSVTPGTVLGSTSVTVKGGRVRSKTTTTTGTGNEAVSNTTIYYDPQLGAGNVYGGGLEGEVTGNTEVTIGGSADIEGRVYAGGRGYRGKMLLDFNDPEEDIDTVVWRRATVDAGAVRGNTSVTVNGGAVRCGVYGGGEGMNYVLGSMGNRKDTVARVYGNAVVRLTGGTIGGGHTHVGDTVTNNGSFAGGRIAPVRGRADIFISGTANVAAVYGGNDMSGKVQGHGRTAQSVGSTLDHIETDILAGTETYVRVEGTGVNVGRLFGGGNGYYPSYYPGRTQNPTLRYLHCTLPTQDQTYVDINTEAAGTRTYTGGRVGMALGGGNMADVKNALVMLHNNGLTDTLLAGGNNATATVSATVKTYATGTVSELDDFGSGCNVKLLFGGNNIATMNILPTLDLQTGVFDRVFGGGNAGKMAGEPGVSRVNDIYGERIVFGDREENKVCTRVVVNSESVTVRNGLYGGSNQAEVLGGTYVGVMATSTSGATNKDYGIYRLFGGNDISEHVAFSRVDVAGGVVHNIFGGGNGYYDYRSSGTSLDAYDLDHPEQNIKVAQFVSGRPTVGSTQVNIWGGRINANIYGGGLAGNCENTHVVIDDRSRNGGQSQQGGGDNAPHNTGEAETSDGAYISGHIYGGGRGILTRTFSNDVTVGRVTGTATTDLYAVTTLTEAYAYGGGYGGDVKDAVINVHEGWNKELEALYGGCFGSDVTGTATVNMYCTPPQEGYNVRTLYGGNDFTGNVANSVVNIYSGHYNKVFGAGNGQYESIALDGTTYTLTTSAAGVYSASSSWPYTKTLSVPNSQYPVVNIYDSVLAHGGAVSTLVDQNVYGGGNLGTCKVKTTGQTRLDDYARVIVNVHGGRFGNDIFAGAAGKSEMDPLIYGIKILNMDGGTVMNSVYGGTESVNDGYAGECISNHRTTGGALDQTTLRPSSIVNLVGGTVTNNVYGGGYLGQVYGSVYINIGKQAVNNCRAYNRTYGSQNHNYGVDPYKPTFNTEEDAVGMNLHTKQLALKASIYAGANWGNGGSSYLFTTPGFYGGESRIRIDGDGYYTSNSDNAADNPNDLPAMDIRYSLIGAGTSCEGGDVLRDIRVLNYGVWNDCSPSKDIWSIQRADSVVLKNVALRLSGDQDAYSAYPSSEISFTRCDTVVFEGHNLVQIEKPAVKMKQLSFVQPSTSLAEEGKSAPVTDMNSMATVVSANSSACNSGTSDQADLCNVVSPVAGTSTLPYTTLLVNNGAYIDVFVEDDLNQPTYGAVRGFGFLRAADATQAIVTARCKWTSPTVHANDGGFLGLCTNDNSYNNEEFPYANYGTAADTTSYRAWKFGQGVRMRQVTLVAHTFPDSLQNNRSFTVDISDTEHPGETAELAVAMVPLELPPAAAGSYYVMKGGITVDQENRELTLVNDAFIPALQNGIIGSAQFADNTQDIFTYGKWISSSTSTEDNPGYKTHVRTIMNDPSHTFGLAIGNGGSFGTACATTVADGTEINGIRCNGDCQTAINGNSWFDGTNGYATTQVTGSDNVVPKLNVYLTYDPHFSTTLMGDVKFTLTEMKPVRDANGIITGYVEEGTVEVTVSISTILTELKDQHYKLVAMKNGFGSHTYSRKLILPATMVRRSLYLTGVEWQPVTSTDEYGGCGSAALFALTDTLTARNHRDYLDQNTFGLKVEPTEDLSASLTTTLGWYSMSENFANGLDVSSLSTNVYETTGNNVSRKVYSADQTMVVEENCEANCTTYHRIINLKTTANPYGLPVGVLDGRSSAGLDFSLFFNGDQKYDPEGTRGRVKLYFEYHNQNTSRSIAYDEEEAQEFKLTLDIVTREKGDTIYVASANSVSRAGVTLYPYGKVGDASCLDCYRYSNNGFVQEYANKGKEPRSYVQSFEQALSSEIYEEGDVICVIDPVILDGQMNFNIHGADHNFIPIIRYSGFHWQFPGDTCAYRGPMVVLKQEGKFSMDHVIIDGSMTSMKKQLQNTHPEMLDANYTAVTVGGTTKYTWKESTWVPDTLAAEAPVFEVTDGGVLTMGDGTEIRNCWNSATATTYNSTTNILSSGPGAVALVHTPRAFYTLSTEPGATQIASHPRMVMNNNVTLKNNLIGPAASSTDSILSGTVHMDGGTLELGVVNKGRKVLVKDNYELLPMNATDELPNFVEQVTIGTGSDAAVRWQPKASYLANLPKANVYLDRDGTTATTDTKSLFISFANEPSAGTRIGISKMFPGPTTRDTITVARNTNSRPHYAATASEQENFFNDGRIPSSVGAEVFYNATISSYNIYFHRCATFQKQVANDNPTADYDELPMLQYRWNELSACPDGTDTVLYSVHGGFYPYTYTWTYTNGPSTEILGTRTTRHSNSEVNTALAASDVSLARESNTDTAILRNIISHDNGTYNYSVKAVDLTGCEQVKNFTVNVQRINEGNSTWVPSTVDDESWTDPDPLHTAKGTRKYRGLHLTVDVVPTQAYGMVRGWMYGTPGDTVSFGPNCGVENPDPATLLCPGEAVQLNAVAKGTNSFVQWDFDPYDVPQTVFVMPNSTDDIAIHAYFAPSVYWKSHVTSQPEGFTTDYWGSVHIHNENELAWLISLVNGMNGQQIHDFYFDTVYIHNATNGGKNDYNMVNYLWTPLGTQVHPFRGVLKVDEGVKIQNIIVNEPNMDYVGFFANTSTATIESLNIINSIFHGGRYVGAITAYSVNDTLRESSVTEDVSGETDNTTILTTNYASGGLVGRAEGTKIDQCAAKAVYMGAAIYNGGMVGYATNVKASNVWAWSKPRMSSLYSGGAFGYSTGSTYSGTGSKSVGGSRIVNSYVRYDHRDGALSRAGGLVGFADNTTLQNDYVYGENKGASLSGAIGSTIGDGVHIENCFYEQGFDHQSFGYYSTLDTTAITTFSGSGAHVILTDTLGNNSNLTRQLNRWVYAHGDTDLNYWQSDTEGVNNGYPVFGAPEYQQLTDVQYVATCDSFTVEGTVCTESGTYQYHAVDSAEFTDTLVVVHLTLNYSEFTELMDTIGAGQDYDGYGFHLTATELDLMRESMQQEGTVTVVVTDTLQTLAGCDSVVTLYLTLSTTGIAPVNAIISVNVYPNPTTKNVTVEATGLQTVELYDAVSRKLQTANTLSQSHTHALTLDLEGLPAGAYYLRIGTENGTVIKKVIKR